MRGLYLMKQRELERLRVVQMVLDGKITQRYASSLLGLSYRQTKRVVRRIKEEGVSGVIHKSRGKSSKRKISDSLRSLVLSLYRDIYPDFSVTLFREKLEYVHDIHLSRETIRKVLIDGNLRKSRKKNKRRVHIFRKRKDSFGELIQIDGSTHRWLEERMDGKLTLMGYIDDATGNTFARFYDYEGVSPFLDSFIRFAKIYGLPKSIYVDRHSTYKTTREPTIEEQLENRKPKTQVERILGNLGVNIIHAYSPQAKGRVERLFKTLQDRLIKEMRLKGIRTKEDANCFLEEYLPVFNKQFAKTPKSNISVFRKLSKDFDYEWSFALEYTRTVGNDYTIRYKGNMYQIENTSSLLRKRKVTVKETISGKIKMFYKGEELKLRKIETGNEVKTEEKTQKREKQVKEKGDRRETKELRALAGS